MLLLIQRWVYFVTVWLVQYAISKQPSLGSNGWDCIILISLFKTFPVVGDSLFRQFPSHSNKMLAQSHFLCKSFDLIPPPSPVLRSTTSSLHQSSSPRSSRFSFLSSSSSSAAPLSRDRISLTMASNSKRPDLSDKIPSEFELDRFAAVGNALADASGEVIRKYFRKKFDIVDKEDMSKFRLIVYNGAMLSLVMLLTYMCVSSKLGSHLLVIAHQVLGELRVKLKFDY